MFAYVRPRRSIAHSFGRNCSRALCACVVGLWLLPGPAAAQTIPAAGATADAGTDNGDSTAPGSPERPPDAAPAPAPQPSVPAGGQAAGAQAAATAPATDSIVLANGRVRIGTVFYGDWAFYSQTGFGPQFVTQTNFPGPGNDHFNSFDVHRTYLNFFFSPTDHVTFRLTPNLFREIGQTTADKLGQVAAMGSTADGNLSMRIKYAFIEFNNFAGASSPYKGTTVRFGSQYNPFIDWEEVLYDYRFVNLVPWNYLSLSSSQVGVSLNGPILSNGKQYIDYQIGVFNDVNFHQFEQSEQKQFMARVSYYPLGAASRFQGFGVTGFYDHGYTNAAPDAGAFPVVRGATLAHYTTPNNGALIAFEYDWGKNAFGTGNLYSGAGPADVFGVGTTGFAGMSKLSQAVLASPSSKQRGFDVFGRANLPNTKFAVFGTYQYFQPNTDVPTDPFDFHRIVAGVAYKINPRLRLAINSQNLVYSHSQFTYPAASIALFSPLLAAANPNGIDNAVPTGIKAAFVSFEFTF